MCKVVRAQDTIDKARNLVEAFYMAASDISGDAQKSALHTLAGVLDDVLAEADELLQFYRAEPVQQSLAGGENV